MIHSVDRRAAVLWARRWLRVLGERVTGPADFIERRIMRQRRKRKPRRKHARQKSCSKIGWPSERMALAYLEQVKILNQSKGHKKEKKNNRLHVYFCEQCAKWHVGGRRRQGETVKRRQ